MRGCESKYEGKFEWSIRDVLVLADDTLGSEREEQ